MVRYRTVWVVTVSTAVTVGVLAALAAVPFAALAALLVCGLVMAATVVWCVEMLVQTPAPWTRKMRVGAATGSTLVAVAGFSSILPGAAVWTLASCALLSAPGMLGRLSRYARRRWAQAHASPAQSGATPVPGLGVTLPPGTLSALDDETLSRAWQVSHTMLSHRLSRDAYLRVVLLRAEYLDELERRHPTAVAQWLADFPHPMADLSPYVHGEDHRHPEIP